MFLQESREEIVKKEKVVKHLLKALLAHPKHF